MIKKMLFLLVMALSFTCLSLPYPKVYTAIITQNHVNDPVVYVMHTDFYAPIIWRRVSKGYYIGKLSGAFPVFNTWAILESDNVSAIIYGNVDEIVIVTRNSSGLPSDNILNHSSVEIRVYEEM